MCGLFGIAGVSIQNSDLSVFRDLMVFNMVRGIDGTGVAYGNTRSNKKAVVKSSGDAQYFNFLLDASTEKDIYNVFNDYLIGHTRWMTVGKVSDEASQPFSFENIVGAHNGTISADYTGFNSDSELLLSRINNVGLNEAVEDFLTEGDAFTLTWFDYRDKTLHFASNGRRPLGFAVHKKRHVIYWSSELEMLKAALSRRGIVSDDYSAFYMVENLHLTFKLNDLMGKNNKAKYSVSRFTPKYKERPKKSYSVIDTTGYEDWWRQSNSGEFEFTNGHGHGYKKHSQGS